MSPALAAPRPIADEPPAENTVPNPDPAPPLPKPKPKPASPKPAHVYHAPRPTPTPAPAPQRTYTPPTPVVHPAARPKVVHRQKRKHRAHHRARHVVASKPVGQVKHAAVVRVAGVPATMTPATQRDGATRAFVISGIGLAALLFLIVVTVPVTDARFTPPGRVLMDHQSHFLLVGVVVLVLTALLYLATGGGS